jgi:hypothetical protein
MIPAHFGNLNPEAALMLFLGGATISLGFADKKPAVLAVTFGVGCIGLSLFLLYLILVPQ